jgi:hypothetical protein
MFKEAHLKQGRHWRGEFAQWGSQHHALPDDNLGAKPRGYLKKAKAWRKV